MARCDSVRYLSFISSSLNASVGVRHPKHFLGVVFKRSQIDFISRFESAATGAYLGRYRRAGLFKFSTEHFCHGACGSQNQASVPIPGLSLRQSRNSIPRSKVIDLRASWGRGPRSTYWSRTLPPIWKGGRSRSRKSPVGGCSGQGPPTRPRSAPRRKSGINCWS